MTSEINEELWYGFDSDEEAEAKAAKSLAGRVGRIVGAKPFPLAARRLAQVTKNPECSIDDVVKVLEYDPALSARLLRLVNSAGFALRTACTSVRHAAALVGLERINQVAVTAAIMDMYAPGNKLASKLLEHTTVVGALSRYLGFHFDLDVEEMFTCGFLHDIGKLMMLDTEGEEYGELLTKAGFKNHDALHLLEREHYGFDHALLGGHVLSAWNIPDPIPKVVAWHHNVTRAYAHSSQVAQPTSVLRLADALSYALCSSQPEVEIEKIGHMEAASYLDISEPQIAAMWSELQTIEQRARLVFRDGTADPAEIFSFRPSRSSLRRMHSFGPLSKSEPARSSKPSTPFPTVSSTPSLPATDYSAEEAAPLRLDTTRKSTDPPELLEQTSIQPKQFPCVVCAGSSYANTCPACGGYACPEHQAGPDEWCSICLKEYKEFGSELLSARGILIGTSIGAVCTGVLFAATGVAAGGPLKVIAGSLLILLLALVLAVIGYGWIRRNWFLRSRPNRATEEAPRVSLDRVVESPRAEVTETPTEPEPIVSLAPAPALASDSTPTTAESFASSRTSRASSAPSLASSMDIPAVLSLPPGESLAASAAPAKSAAPPRSVTPPAESSSVFSSAPAEPLASSATPSEATASAPSLSAPSETVSVPPISSDFDQPLLAMPDPLLESLDAHVYSSLAPRPFRHSPRSDVLVTSLTPETGPSSVERHALALLSSVQTSVLPTALAANAKIESTPPGGSVFPNISATPTLPMSFALHGLVSAVPASTASSLPPSLEPFRAERSTPPVPVTFPPCSIPSGVDVNPTAPTSRPPPPSDTELGEYYAAVVRTLPPNSLSSLSPSSLSPSSLSPSSLSPSSLSPSSLSPRSVPRVSIAPDPDASETAPTSRPPKLEVEIDPYRPIGTPALTWTAIADSHGAAAGW